MFFVFLLHHGGVRATDLISTGEAAEILGCSRQHVVDLCDAGKLAVTRKGGSHRYVHRSEVMAMTVPPLTRDEEQSRWLHAAIVGHLVRDPDSVLAKALENLDRFALIHQGTMAERWLDLWREILNSGPDSVLNNLTADTGQARELRQNSPFTGIMPDTERAAVLHSFRQHWHSTHSL